MARREGIGAADPYRELQVDPAACPEVIEAAFVVLREMVLRSEDDEAPRRLARLIAAHRTLADPARRAAHDRTRTLRLEAVDLAMLDPLTELAVADADPAEVMPCTGDPVGWTDGRREAFRAFHRERLDGLAGPPRELSLAVLVEERPVGIVRLAHAGPPDRLELGIWLGRAARGAGIGTVALRAAVDRAADLGATTVVAETTADNRAAMGALRRCGAVLTTRDDGAVRAEIGTAGPI